MLKTKKPDCSFKHLNSCRLLEWNVINDKLHSMFKLTNIAHDLKHTHFKYKRKPLININKQNSYIEIKAFTFIQIAN